MKTIQNLLIPLCAVLMLALTGCTKVQLASVQLDATAKAFLPVADKAVVYIYRNSTFAYAVPVELRINDKHIGELMVKSYARIELPSGKCQILAKTGTSCNLTIDVEAGKIFYVRQQVKGGVWTPSCDLSIVTEEVGKSAVNQCKLIQSLEY